MRSSDGKEMEAARLFSLLHTGSPGDVDFYTAACRGAGSVLELGCGFGRLLAPLAQAGLQVTGVDSDPAMLQLARKNLATLPGDAARLRRHQSVAFLRVALLPAER